MDGWIKLQKRKYYLLMKCSVSTQKTLVRDVHAAEVRYHLDCWLDVTKTQACWSSAIVTTVSSIIYWSGASATDSIDGWILL